MILLVFGEFEPVTDESWGNSEKKMETLAGSDSERALALDSTFPARRNSNACVLKELDELEIMFPKFRKETKFDLGQHAENDLRATNLPVMESMALTYHRYGMIHRTEAILSLWEQFSNLDTL
uniref:AlNc14C57G4311 protein n=1 Tax=Albugo laibachii Nc14 TaxID=890382 RepID=F0WCD1_9STRA|nr:AlNc14C57G4311 [Albugo laibachii Nc14]|eukprot:CCA18846.1 AlNc14C57G4311 [Albugo laibachii Nc14]